MILTEGILNQKTELISHAGLRSRGWAVGAHGSPRCAA
jgi:hypothetical protein